MPDNLIDKHGCKDLLPGVLRLFWFEIECPPLCVTNIDQGYDEEKSAEQLNLREVKMAAEFRGGKCLSDKMIAGNWKQKLHF